jgi:site-specific DNA-adenine methylase
VLDEVVSRHFDLSRFNSVVSPFFGGGSFEFYLQRKYGFRLVVNDKFTPLYSFGNR